MCIQRRSCHRQVADSMMCVCDLEPPPELGRIVRSQTATQVSERSGLHRKGRTDEAGRPKSKRSHPAQATHSQPQIAIGLSRHHQCGTAVIVCLGPSRRNRATAARHARFPRAPAPITWRPRTGRAAPLDLRSPLRYARLKHCTLGCWIAKKPSTETMVRYFQ